MNFGFRFGQFLEDRDTLFLHFGRQGGGFDHGPDFNQSPVRVMMGVVVVVMMPVMVVMLLMVMMAMFMCVNGDERPMETMRVIWPGFNRDMETAQGGEGFI